VKPHVTIQPEEYRISLSQKHSQRNGNLVEAWRWMAIAHRHSKTQRFKIEMRVPPG